MWYSVIPTWRRNKYLMPNICYCNSSTDYYTSLVTKNHNQKKERCLFSLFKLERILYCYTNFLLRSIFSFLIFIHKAYYISLWNKVHFFEYFKTRLLFQMDNYSAQHFYVSYFNFDNGTYCNFCSNYNNLTNIIVIFSTFHCKYQFSLSIYLLYSVIFIWNLHH